MRGKETTICTMLRSKINRTEKKNKGRKRQDSDKGDVCVYVSMGRKLSEALLQSISINKGSVGGRAISIPDTATVHPHSSPRLYRTQQLTPRHRIEK